MESRIYTNLSAISMLFGNVATMTTLIKEIRNTLYTHNATLKQKECNIEDKKRIERLSIQINYYKE